MRTKNKLRFANSDNSLFNYYTSEVHSFVSHLNKVKASPNEKNIHKLRVDIKRICAIVHLFDTLFQNDFKGSDQYANFKNIFKNAGRIREIQVNLICLSQYKLAFSTVSEYTKFSNDRKKKLKKKLKKNVEYFNSSLFNDSKPKIKRLCKAINNTKIISKCWSFIMQEISKIKKISPAGNNSVLIHEIRRHIKSLGTIAVLLYEINPTKELEKLLALIKETEVMMGNWHDKIVLISSLEKFFVKNENAGDKKNLRLKQLPEIIEKENQRMLKKIEFKVRSVLGTIYAFHLEHSL